MMDIAVPLMMVGVGVAAMGGYYMEALGSEVVPKNRALMYMVTAAVGSFLGLAMLLAGFSASVILNPLNSLLDGLLFVLGGWLAMNKVIWMVVLGVGLGAVILFGDYAAKSDDVDYDGFLPTVASVAKVILSIGLVYFGWRYIQEFPGGPVDAIVSWWWIAPLALLAYLVFTFSQQRRRYASNETAVRNMRRRVNRDMQSLSGTAFGILALGITIAAGILAGAIGQLGAVGEVGSMFVGELGFLLTTFLGYAALGGEKAPFSLELSPLAFVGVALFIGGIALIIRET
ncbi:MAG: hypothetical protein ACOC8O_01345 [Natronomonas sp.]